MGDVTTVDVFFAVMIGIFVVSVVLVLIGLVAIAVTGGDEPRSGAEPGDRPAQGAGDNGSWWAGGSSPFSCAGGSSSSGKADDHSSSCGGVGGD